MVRPRADRAGLDRRLVVGDLVVAEGDVQQHLMGRRVRQRVGGHPRRVPVGLAAIPEQLHQAEHQRPVFFVRIARVKERREFVEVHRARQQHRVVHRRNAE